MKFVEDLFNKVQGKTLMGALLFCFATVAGSQHWINATTAEALVGVAATLGFVGLGHKITKAGGATALLAGVGLVFALGAPTAATAADIVGIEDDSLKIAMLKFGRTFSYTALPGITVGIRLIADQGTLVDMEPTEVGWGSLCYVPGLNALPIGCDDD